jgi:hypothetical protein
MHTNNAFEVKYTQQHCNVFSQLPYILTGFKTGSFVSEADAVSIAKRRQGKLGLVLVSNGGPTTINLCKDTIGNLWHLFYIPTEQKLNIR